ncbi:tRNA (N(6)-L-threonylcarbamoyladenosine(37)-C(2))-methylthiotransferase MtaB [Treponema parvum]|uniref:tRNA (N(6)-L-threonylcarbamoyladenosine(37)-C(2))- methylthiotransferase MtaB n=1 Tax=Treponema parvum TaxID=138851 RepID=UPI001AEC5ABD|nr:tRNA (N(6)-L-threonylcarbamoyladenosine(37)-C(2))-methylthiotransferase MtaB [Treponema parvum]QTQ15889.1 tRNA (N(6)-L-threonylcarbamoyladenosine(37)-C(2))-methylthiotransferase MtaB [Treponema parvum]
MRYHVHFETLGCRLNQIESESAARFFSDSGFSVDLENMSASAVPAERTVLCVVNTCTVTTKAEQKARRVIRLLLKKYPAAAVVVTGCYAQVEPDEISAMDERIAVLPGMKKSRLADIPPILSSFIHERPKSNCAKYDAEYNFDACGFVHHLSEKLFSVSGGGVLSPPRKQPLKPAVFKAVPTAQIPASAKNTSFIGFSEDPFRLSTDTFLAHSRSSIKIQDGCNCSCTYCRIRIARGNSVSLDAESVLSRVQALQRAGQSEVVITSVNIAQYASEYGGRKIGFTDLLQILLDKTDGIAFRLSSLYPEVVDEKFCALASDDRIRPHFHLSVQSGSDKILKAMNRPYRIEQVYKAVELLKAAKKDPFLACDIIAGFPGETDEDFDKTLELCRKANFTWIHVFPFSPRPGTKAYSMKPKVAQSVTGKRVSEIFSLACKNKTDYILAMKGKALTAVAEKAFKADHGEVKNAGEKRPQGGRFKNTSCFSALTENFLHCIVDCGDCGEKTVPRPGTSVKIKIVSPLEDEIRAGKEEEARAKLVRVF